MKSICGWQKVVIFGICILSMMGDAQPVWAQVSWKVTCYSSIKVENNLDLHIAGVDLAKYDYARIDHYVATENGDIFVAGASSANGSPKLSVISPASNQKLLITEKLGWARRPDQIAFLVFYLNDIPNAFVLVEYADVNVSRETEEGTTYLELFRAVPEEERYVSLHHEILTETMIYIDWSSDAQYPYIDFSDTPKTGGPATKERMKYFLSDVNGDGYADILVWKGKFMARGRNEPGGGDFFLAGEELHVMYFEPDELSFYSMTSIEPDPIRADYEILIR